MARASDVEKRQPTRRGAIAAMLLPLAGCTASSGTGAAPAPTMTPPRPAPSAPTPPPGPPPVVMAGAQIWTGDPILPRVSMLLWRGSRVTELVPLGRQAAVADPTPLVNFPGGAFAVPGLVDAHAHLMGLGRSLMQLGLRGDRLDAIADKVRRTHAERPAGEWLTGRGWDQNLWSPPEMPNHKLLDDAAPGRPVFLRRIDGHAGWASAEALKLAGITRTTKDPPGGRILRDRKGEPTGVLVDNAMELMGRVMKGLGPAEIERAILLAQDDVLSRGLTTVHEMGVDAETEAVYRGLDERHLLRVRVYAMMDDGPNVLPRLAARPEADDPNRRFHLAGVKLYVDGALGSRGAALLKPYSDEPGQSGLLVSTPEHIAEVATAALRTGWQVAVHAIGDRGNRIVLDAFEQALRAVPDARDGRLRVEHAQILDPADIPRFARLGVIASMQPTHATSDMPWVPARLGPNRLAGAYAWQSLVKSGAHLCSGSDFPVELPDPILGLCAAVTRQDGDGKPPGGWLPAERMTVEQALRSFTAEGAHCAHRERDFGVLREGSVADVTVFDRDLTAIPPSEIKNVKVLATIVGGVVEYRAPQP